MSRYRRLPGFTSANIRGRTTRLHSVCDARAFWSILMKCHAVQTIQEVCALVLVAFANYVC